QSGVRGCARAGGPARAGTAGTGAARANPMQGWRSDAAMMVGVVLVLCVLSIAFGERIGINGGQGWDGMAYTAWAEDFWQRVIVEHLTRYHSQRVLPSALVHYGLPPARPPRDAAHLIGAFQILQPPTPRIPA